VNGTKDFFFFGKKVGRKSPHYEEKEFSSYKRKKVKKGAQIITL